MKQLFMKQKIMSLSGKFSVTDAEERAVYYVDGSFLQIPKTFTIMNVARDEVAHITKKVFSFLPKFFVEVNGHEVLTIQKELSLFKARYTIVAEGIEVKGNWWDMRFDVLRHDEVIGSVRKAWLSWGDRYEIDVRDEQMEAIMIAIVVAIDCVKADQGGGAA